MTVRPWRGRLALFLLTLAGGCGLVRAQAPDALPGRGCATYLEVMKLLDANEPAGQAAGLNATTSAAATTRAARIQAATLSGRAYLTPHFALHYTLAPTVNRPRWVPEDASDPLLKSLVDSLLATLSSLSATARDSALHAKLDSMNAAHPRYVRQAGEYFERAWTHYDSLGMRMPDSSASRYFKAPLHGRVAIDIANIGSMEPGYNGPYYGLAWPPEGGYKASILLENDFLYNAVYNTGLGQATGTPIRALYKGETYRDYSVSWDLGLKVTASHEFYHIVQYEYTPSLSGYHAWYELSATGMEERLAPEVNDYFQYLPFNVPHNHDAPLTTAGTLANYGNGIFHVFLTTARGMGFDRVIWEHLGNESLVPRNHLGNALLAMAGSQEAWDSLFTAYAAALSIAGTPGAATSPLAFSPDMAEWPVPNFETTTDVASAQYALPAATFRLVRAPATGTLVATLAGFSHSRRVDSSAAGYQSFAQSSPAVSVGKGAGVTRSTSVFANSGFTGTRNVLLAKPGNTLTIARNPLPRSAGTLFILAPSGGAQDTVRVVSQSGRRVAAVPADSSGAFWSWNLKDQAGRTVPAGLYFVRRGGEAPQSLLILP